MLVDFDLTIMSSLVLALANCTVSHLAVNHGLVTMLPHIASLTRAGVTTSAVTTKALALDCEKVKASGSGEMSLTGEMTGAKEVATVGWVVGLGVTSDASCKLCFELFGNV